MAEVPSQVLQNYDPCCEDAINTHIQLLLHASYVYLAMAFYFDLDDVSLGNFKRFFQRFICKASVEVFLFLQNEHGGHVLLTRIVRPDPNSWQGGLRAMECAFHMEMTINQNLLNLHELAKGKGDAYLCNFLEQHCLDEQANVLKKMGSYLTNLRQMEAPEYGLAEYLFDKLSLS
ncbi:ferritin heavy polypeptide-like 17 [Mus caroli]|uniref:Ferritin n=1 Tax=Mus caroli TaxID=10089 RepID=A0A6P5PB59_MUSCR|nr:ferritin heavy polypeptide-like 17 [Mus caroli]